jgi:hypothetical protein
VVQVLLLQVDFQVQLHIMAAAAAAAAELHKVYIQPQVYLHLQF